jgi:hypothetical protein
MYKTLNQIESVSDWGDVLFIGFHDLATGEVIGLGMTIHIQAGAGTAVNVTGVQFSRSATIGSTAIARRAGRKQEASATIPRAAITIA